MVANLLSYEIFFPRGFMVRFLGLNQNISKIFDVHFKLQDPTSTPSAFTAINPPADFFQHGKLQILP